MNPFDQQTPLCPGPRKDVSIRRATHRIGCRKHVMTGRTQSPNAREREVLVSQNLH